MSFDRLAPFYRTLEVLTFGKALWTCRTRLFGDFLSVRRALVLGDGDGRFTAKLIAELPQLKADSVDNSSAMLRLARKRIRTIHSSGCRVQYIQADVRNFPMSPPGWDRWDGIVTHFFLDCLSQEEVQKLASTLASQVREGCVWLISEFAIPPKQPFRFLGRILIRLMYWIFQKLTGLQTQRLPDYAQALHSAAFARRNLQTSLFGLLRSETWVFTGRRSPLSLDSAGADIH